MPAAYAHEVITVLRITATGGTTTVLLAAGTGPSERLLAGWSADGGGHWTLSPALPLKGATVTSASPGPGSSLAITLSHRRAATITSAAGPWRLLPELPPYTATLAPGSSGGWNALAVARHPAHHLAGRAGCARLDQGPGHQGSGPVRLVRLTQAKR